MTEMTPEPQHVLTVLTHDGKVIPALEAHALITGPISKVVPVDGHNVDITPPVVYFHEDHKHLIPLLMEHIGKHHEMNGHPHMVEFDDDLGHEVQRPFRYDGDVIAPEGSVI